MQDGTGALGRPRTPSRYHTRLSKRYTTHQERCETSSVTPAVWVRLYCAETAETAGRPSFDFVVLYSSVVYWDGQ